MYVLLVIIILLIIYYGNRKCHCSTEKYATVAVNDTTNTTADVAAIALRAIGAKPKKIHKLSATPTRKTTTIRPVTYYRQNF